MFSYPDKLINQGHGKIYFLGVHFSAKILDCKFDQTPIYFSNAQIPHLPDSFALLSIASNFFDARPNFIPVCTRNALIMHLKCTKNILRAHDSCLINDISLRKSKTDLSDAIK